MKKYVQRKSFTKLLCFVFFIESVCNLKIFLKNDERRKKNIIRKKRNINKIFSFYYLTGKQTKPKQWSKEWFKSTVLLYLSVHKQTWEHNVNIFLEQSSETFYNEEGNNC